MYYIHKIDLDDASIIRRTPEVEHERAIAIADILEGNHFRPLEISDVGPYALFISVAENRLSLYIRSMLDAESGSEQGEPAGAAGGAKLEPERGKRFPPDHTHKISLMLSPFRGIIKDYFLVCESYFDAIKHATPQKIETIDMARRSIHNEGSDLLSSLLKGRVELDSETSRRLFTLVCVLHIK